MIRPLLIPTAGLLALAPLGAAQAQLTEITGFGRCVDMDANGEFLLTSIGYVWDPSGTTTPKFGADDAVGISLGGAFLAGNNDDGTQNTPAWHDGTDWISLGGIPGSTGCGPDLGSAYDISSDGLVVVGLAWNGCTTDAFKWDATSGVFTALPNSGTESARANCTNFDGSWVGGWDRGNFSNNRPAVWDPTNTVQVLNTQSGEVWALTSDGSIAVGQLGSNAARWETGSGAETLLPILPGFEMSQSFAFGVDATGTTIVGQAGAPPFAIPTAFYWREDVGTVDLNVLAAELGAPPPSAPFANAVAISDDGNTIAGALQGIFLSDNAYYLELPEAWLRTDGTTSISLAAGGSQDLTLNAGPEQAGKLYLMLGSLAGTSPGTAAGTGTLPLNFDAYTQLLLTSPNSIVSNSVSNLDSVGASSATLTIPAGSNPAAAGLTMHHAYLVIDILPGFLGVGEISNPVAVDLVP